MQYTICENISVLFTIRVSNLFFDRLQTANWNKESVYSTSTRMMRQDRRSLLERNILMFSTQLRVDDILDRLSAKQVLNPDVVDTIHVSAYLCSILGIFFSRTVRIATNEKKLLRRCRDAGMWRSTHFMMPSATLGTRNLLLFLSLSSES